MWLKHIRFSTLILFKYLMREHVDQIIVFKIDQKENWNWKMIYQHVWTEYQISWINNWLEVSSIAKDQIFSYFSWRVMLKK